MTAAELLPSLAQLPIQIPFPGSPTSTPGVLDNPNQIQNFMSGAGFTSSPFGYVPQSQFVASDIEELMKKGEGAVGRLMPKLPGIKGVMNRLKDVYKSAGTAFDSTGLMAEGQRTRDYGLAVGTGAANTAAQEYLNSPNGGDATGAAVIRARALMPAMKQDSEFALALQEMKMKAAQEQVKTSAAIASSIADTKSNYINTLANYNSNKASNVLNFAGLGMKSNSETNANKIAMQDMLSRFIPRPAPTLTRPM